MIVIFGYDRAMQEGVWTEQVGGSARLGREDERIVFFLGGVQASTVRLHVLFKRFLFAAGQ